MQITVKERLKAYLKYKKVNASEFSRIIGVSTAFVNSIRVSIQPDKVESIASNFTDLNIEWLLTGKGEMLKYENDSKSLEGIQNVDDFVGSREMWDMIRQQQYTIQQQQYTIQQQHRLIEELTKKMNNDIVAAV